MSCFRGSEHCPVKLQGMSRTLLIADAEGSYLCEKKRAANAETRHDSAVACDRALREGEHGSVEDSSILAFKKTDSSNCNRLVRKLNEVDPTLTVGRADDIHVAFT